MLVIEYRLLIIIFFHCCLVLDCLAPLSYSRTNQYFSIYIYFNAVRVGSRILHSRPSQVIPRSFLILAEKTITSSASLRIAAHSRSACSSIILAHLLLLFYFLSQGKLHVRDFARYLNYGACIFFVRTISILHGHFKGLMFSLSFVNRDTLF
jgi:hypothetical protein